MSEARWVLRELWPTLRLVLLVQLPVLTAGLLGSEAVEALVAAGHVGWGYAVAVPTLTLLGLDVLWLTWMLLVPQRVSR